MFGNIYKIIHNQSDIVYVGSTFDTLRNRWQIHKYANTNNNKKSNISIYSYFKQYGIENFKIILIKQYDVVDRKHLCMYEQLWMNKMKCINKNSSFQILINNYRKNYYNENKEKIIERVKEYSLKNKLKVKEYQNNYYNENKELLNEKRNLYSKNYYKLNKIEISKKIKEKITCECGSIVNKYGLSIHQKSKKHLK